MGLETCRLPRVGTDVFVGRQHEKLEANKAEPATDGKGKVGTISVGHYNARP
jgi:hypothetical protein